MKRKSALFSYDDLVSDIAKAFETGLKREGIMESKKSDYSNLECLLSGLAVFAFKSASLLQFDHSLKSNRTLLGNLKTLFNIHKIPSDTQMRTRLDLIDPAALRPAFTKVFQLLQRSKVLDEFRFLETHHLISLDGTGMFSSHNVYCDNCCVKNHKNGEKTYYHQLLAASIVHPDQKVTFPLAPEPIMKEDGAKKNDCERNAAKRWISNFKREHPHLKAVILADGLASNEPFITLLKNKNLHFILVCKESDHAYLTDWINAMDGDDKVILSEKDEKREAIYEYFKEVPLNDSKNTCKVDVVRFTEKIKSRITKWMWVTDLSLEKKHLKEFVRGARSRWKIENETFNTLKNQGYEFEHNFGHGNKNLNTVFSYLILIAFLLDQCMQKVNRLFQRALEKSGTKRVMWQSMLHAIKIFVVPNFETLYGCIADPPRITLTSIV
jgi:hypothetical protein